MVLSQILRFSLPHSTSISAPAFLKLREFVTSQGQVQDQYFGYITPVFSQRRTNEICWVIQWPHGSELRTSPEFRTKLNEVTDLRDTKSLLFEFNDSQLAELKKGLESPVTEFACPISSILSIYPSDVDWIDLDLIFKKAIINLSPTAPLQNADLQHSMHKTYTDCYLYEKGFTGGNWAYSLNTNDTDELLKDPTEEQVIPEGERRLACYYLGWESIELHRAAARTALFDEEIDKLKPWFGPGTTAWYAKFSKHS